MRLNINFKKLEYVPLMLYVVFQFIYFLYVQSKYPRKLSLLDVGYFLYGSPFLLIIVGLYLLNIPVIKMFLKYIKSFYISFPVFALYLLFIYVFHIYFIHWSVNFTWSELYNYKLEIVFFPHEKELLFVLFTLQYCFYFFKREYNINKPLRH
jgi:hypothetical protein